jgi:hypothetical protein
VSTRIEYVAGAELPPLQLELLDESSSVIDLTGATGSLKLSTDTDTAAALTKTSGLTFNTNGCTVAWSAGDLELAAGTYLGQITATLGGLDYRRQFTLVILPKIA